MNLEMGLFLAQQNLRAESFFALKVLGVVLTFLGSMRCGSRAALGIRHHPRLLSLGLALGTCFQGKKSPQDPLLRVSIGRIAVDEDY